MNLSELRAELEIDEGVKYEIYLDHLGCPTFGIGHLITFEDDVYGMCRYINRYYKGKLKVAPDGDFTKIIKYYIYVGLFLLRLIDQYLLVI